MEWLLVMRRVLFKFERPLEVTSQVKRVKVDILSCLNAVWHLVQTQDLGVFLVYYFGHGN
jgi:hypothetical protein